MDSFHKIYIKKKTIEILECSRLFSWDSKSVFGKNNYVCMFMVLYKTCLFWVHMSKINQMAKQENPISDKVWLHQDFFYDAYNIIYKKVYSGM